MDDPYDLEPEEDWTPYIGLHPYSQEPPPVDIHQEYRWCISCAGVLEPDDDYARTLDNKIICLLCVGEDTRLR